MGRDADCVPVHHPRFTWLSHSTVHVACIWPPTTSVVRAARATVPLAMLQRLVIQGRARLDTNLLAALGEHGVDVLLLGARHGRRRPPPDPVNACLSLGYTLLHNEALQAWPGSEEQAQ